MIPNKHWCATSIPSMITTLSSVKDRLGNNYIEEETVFALSHRRLGTEISKSLKIQLRLDIGCGVIEVLCVSLCCSRCKQGAHDCPIRACLWTDGWNTAILNVLISPSRCNGCRESKFAHWRLSIPDVLKRV